MRLITVSINRLSLMCGITQSTLNNIINGHNHSTTVSTTQEICDGLDITIQDFFDDDLFKEIEQELKQP
ncbi:helix-turn-helix transcriptional regulator [Pseudoflavonifractor phocaeensis]|uniref:helix-turn-helix domain-containing protein n=1 Tax=Pseudoflavonifractor phocaeensis TaxID=1870988 RepID=UPI0030B89EE9